MCSSDLEKPKAVHHVFGIRDNPHFHGNRERRHPAGERVPLWCRFPHVHRLRRISHRLWLLMGNRSDLDAYNRESLRDLSDERIAELSPDKQEQVRATKKSEGLYGGIMMIATALGLLLLFVPAFHAQSFFWLTWPIGGILCGAIAAFRGETRR